MRSFKHSFYSKNNEIKIIAIYTVVFFAGLLVIRLFFRENLFEASNFLYWDAEHYDYIRKFRYEDYRVAFFPLLPIIWKWFALDIHGIAIFNGIIFLSSFWLLSRELRMSFKEIAISITIPSFIFFFLPFSESLFFFSSSLILLGLKNNKTYLLLTGLFLASLSRPAFLILIPALIVTEFLTAVSFKFRSNMQVIGKLGVTILVLAAGTFLVALIQYYDTHEWFKFLEVQKGWGNHLQIPKLPLTSWAGGYIVRLDGSAFFVGTLSGVFLLLWILRTKFVKNFNLPKEVIFSLAYLGGITLSVLMFRGGSLFSLNRFVYATAFIIVAFHFFYDSLPAFKPRHLIFIFIGILLFFTTLFQSWSHIQTFMKYFFLSFYLLLPFTLKSETKWVNRVGFILLLLLNIFFQLSFYLRFLDGGWIG